MAWEGGHATWEETVYKFLVVKSEGKPFGRPRHKWEDNIKINLKGIGWEGNRICVAQHSTSGRLL
jgi:hypothetical protein